MDGMSIWGLPLSEFAFSLGSSFGTANIEFTSLAINGGMERCARYLCFLLPWRRAAFLWLLPWRSSRKRPATCGFHHTDDRPVTGMENRVQPENFAGWQARGLRSPEGQLER